MNVIVQAACVAGNAIMFYYTKNVFSLGALVFCSIICIATIINETR